MFHLALHFMVPAVIAGVFFRRRWPLACGLMIATMLVDVDHLLAQPIYSSERCSIGFHPLHEPWFIAFYLGLCLLPGRPILRLLGIGLSVHMALDALDCQMTSGVWVYSRHLDAVALSVNHEAAHRPGIGSVDYPNGSCLAGANTLYATDRNRVADGLWPS